MNRPVAILIPDLQGGGAQRQAALLTRGWAQHGRPVTVVTYEPEGSIPFYTFPETVRIYYLNMQTSSQSTLAGVQANLKRVGAVRRAITEIDPAIIFSFLPEMTVTGWLAARPLNIPVIACERTDPSVYPTGLWRTMRNLAYPRCAQVVCQSRRAAAYFDHNCRTVVIPNAVLVPDRHTPSDIQRPKGRFIVSLGRLSREKGHDLLIDAFAHTAQDFHDVSLLLIGEGPERAALEKLIHDRGLQDRVSMPGASKNPFAVLAEAALFVLPSRFEGFPNALAEAMALGLPCIATEGAAGTEGLVHDNENGWLVPNENPAAMARAIKNCLAAPERAARVAENARNVTVDYAPDRIFAQWDKVIEAVL